MAFKDIIVEQGGNIARISINRPKTLNAFTDQTVQELFEAIMAAGSDRNIGVIVLGGTGDRAFCVGRDNRELSDGSSMPVDYLYSAIRDVPQPVIARVQGYAIGGGNVLSLLCDLTIASERAVFGQVGPRVGAVDPGWGTALLAHTIGEKKAREMWYLCKRYSAQEALNMGLCNAVVPHEQLDQEIDNWSQEILKASPSALTIAKRSFNAATEQMRGQAMLGKQAVHFFRETDESKEGTRAFLEKRSPNFRGPPNSS